MKFILAHNFYQQGGGEDRAFYNEVRLLRSAGHEVIEYVRTNDEIKSYGICDKLTLGPALSGPGTALANFGKC